MKGMILSICLAVSVANGQSVLPDSALTRILIQVFDNDQIVRTEWVKVKKELGANHPVTDSLKQIVILNDQKNQQIVSEILDQYGWLSDSRIGTKANQALFLVIQHSTKECRTKYIPLMRQAVKLGNANAQSLALLEDRTALENGHRQIYGSQVGTHPETGEYFVQPLEDPDGVDYRRAMVGLQPLSYYLAHWDLAWNIEDYKQSLPGLEKWYFQASKN